MADETKTLAELLTLVFQDDQPESSITEQDLRNMILTLTPAIGGIHFSTAVETVISLVSTKTKALGTTSILETAHDVDMPQNNRIRYIGTTERHFMIDVALSTTAAGNNKLLHYQLFKNGIALPETLIPRVHGTGADHGAIPITTNVHLETNDYIELFVSNETDDSNLTIVSGTINMVGFIVE